jgi:Mg2+ and Co2+ transporter CorA
MSNMESNIVAFPNAVPRAKVRAEYRSRTGDGQKNMHTYLFRSREALLEANEAELVRDVSMDLDKASKKLNGIRERLKGVQENYDTEMQSLKAAERKLAAAIVEALLSGQR